MKTITKNNSIQLLAALSIALVIFSSCERDLSVDADFATHADTADIFTDDFIAMGTNFYFPYLGSKPDAWSVDSNEGYESSASMRIDVPNANNPEGNYAGAIFLIDGAGRNLTNYDALTFWGKASQNVTIEQIGFGEDFLENKFVATANNLDFTTNWKKYVVPIPDASKLINERGVLRYATGTLSTDFIGFTFWLDELKFEKLGTLRLHEAKIMNGQNAVQSMLSGISTQVTGLSTVFNMQNGTNQSVATSPAYFRFKSSNPSVASVDEQGVVTTHRQGSAVITATIDGVDANGSLTVNALGQFNAAPAPTRPASSVISIFSDAYTNVDVDYYNGYFTPDGQTTEGGAMYVGNGENIISYTALNFVGIGTFLNVPSVNASNMTHLHVDLNVQEAMQASDFIRLVIINDVGANETSGSYTINRSELSTNQWKGFDIPLSSFPGLNDTSKLGLLFFVSDATISNLFVDNIYFYSE